MRIKKIKIGDEFLEVKDCNWWQKGIGLTFCRREKAKALLFDFKKNTKIKLTSWFVFFPFLAIWLDSDDKVIEKRIIPLWKFSISPKKEFTKLIEIPISRLYSKILKLLEDTKDL